MRWVPVLLACGCNSVFGLTPTDLVDAPPPIDAPAPPHCPAIGELPSFADDLHQIPAVACTAYAYGDNQIAIAMCNNQLSRGPVDGEMTPIMLDEPVSDPRVSPEGDEVFVLHYNQTTFQNEVFELQWRDDKFEQIGTFAPPSATTYLYTFSTPSRGPDRSLVYFGYDYSLTGYVLVQVSIVAGVWTEMFRYPITELGLDPSVFLMQFALSGDGLRLMFMTPGVWKTDPSGQYTYTDPVYYADRASITDHFNPAIGLQNVPEQVQWPFLAPDCGRIYFSALNRVFYLKQPI